VAVGLALGLTVTSVNARAAGAVPQAVLNRINTSKFNRKVTRRLGIFIGSRPAQKEYIHGQGTGVSGVTVGVELGKAVMVAVAVGGVVGDGTVAVAVKVGTLVGVNVEMGISVAVAVTVAVRVRVGKIMDTGVKVAVAVARGVRVATFGTQMICPTLRLYWLLDIQLANWSWAMLTPKAWLKLYIVSPGRTV